MLLGSMHKGRTIPYSPASLSIIRAQSYEKEFKLFVNAPNRWEFWKKSSHHDHYRNWKRIKAQMGLTDEEFQHGK